MHQQIKIENHNTKIEFEKKGYVRYQSFFSAEECQEMRQAYENNIKNNDKPFYRIKSNSIEKNKYTHNGYVVNPFMNLHLDEDSSIANPFLKFFNNKKIFNKLKKFDKREFELHKTMYFESNRGTERHFDSDIFGTTSRMIGVWVALEDINPENGGFFFYPYTHKLWIQDHFSEQVQLLFSKYREYSAMKTKNYSNQNRGSMLSIYKKGNKALEEIIEQIGSEQLGPSWKQGDAIIFDGNLLHGSFRPKNFDASRNSVSAHFSTKKTNS